LGRREDAGGQVIFEKEHADELGLIEQRQAENRSRVVLKDIRIRSKG
jgi:hypothetical protein